MQRPSAPSRRVIVIAVAVTAAAGVGFGAYTLGSAAGANSSYLPSAATAPAAPDQADVPGAAPSTPSTTPEEIPATGLTLEEAQAVALEVAPGRVVEWDEDNEPTGLRYDIKVLHDNGTTTDVEVDTVTGQVTSIDHDDDRY